MAKSMRTRLTADERRAQILRAAIKIFAKSNYRVARVTDIASEAGISDALIYKHFASKKAILLAILDYISQRMIRLWDEDVKNEKNALTALRMVVLSYYKRMLKHPEELKVHFQAVSEICDAEIADRLRLSYESFADYYSKVIQKGIQQGTIRKDADVNTVAWAINGLGMFMNMTRLLSFTGTFKEEVLKNILDNLIDSVKN
jgi:AcrR family transcriptional regulator